MKKIIKSIAVILSITIFASCSTTLPYEVTNNPIGTKVGKSSTATIFGWEGGWFNRPSSTGWRFNKNYSIYDAAKKGGITRVATVDLKTTSFILYRKYELIVTGE